MTGSHQTEAARGCTEYAELSRRGFLAASGLAAAAVAAPAWLPRIAFAKDYRSSMRDVIISIYLRGASDGLTMCVPYGDNAYYSLRPTLAIARPDSSATDKATDLDGFFGLPPAMLPLLPAYQAQRLAIVHACGSTDASRSHFDAQRFMEVGKADDPTLLTGWLGRHIANIPPLNPSAVLRGVGLSTGLARTLVGAPDTLPIANLSGFNLAGAQTSRTARRMVIDNMYNGTLDPLKAAGLTTLQTIDTLANISFSTYQPSGGANYGTSAFGSSMKSVAALLKAQVGVEAVAIDVNGWDTHTNQGNISGTMAALMASIAQVLAAFDTDLTSGPTQPSYIAVVMSEFGRRAAENGSAGTDHGHGNCMLVLGSAVQGGRVVSQWPGLAPGQLYEGLDLDVTIDYRDVLAEICAQRLGAPDLSVIFPDYAPTFRNIVA
ncbi:MAG: DUF1501 domain-containing protein [Leptolyngbya sp. PLA1]|nr:DUF1501 domain-containing protein [Leptolyngbya sp. PLA1]